MKAREGGPMSGRIHADLSLNQQERVCKFLSYCFNYFDVVTITSIWYTLIYITVIYTM